jgi:flagellar operon protein
MTDVKNVSRIQDLARPTESGKAPATGIGPSFKETFEQLNKTENPQSGLDDLSKLDGRVRFSNHALERMRSRGIAFKAEDMERLQTAVDKADKKGSKDSLVLMGDSAFVVSVKNKTVVTVMDRNMMKDNVFTNIDSTIIL